MLFLARSAFWKYDSGLDTCKPAIFTKSTITILTSHTPQLHQSWASGCCDNKHHLSSSCHLCPSTISLSLCAPAPITTHQAGLVNLPARSETLHTPLQIPGAVDSLTDFSTVGCLPGLLFSSPDHGLPHVLSLLLLYCFWTTKCHHVKHHQGCGPVPASEQG